MNSDTVINFSKLSKYDVTLFLTDFINFSSNLSNAISYYNGLVSKLDNNFIPTLTDLQNRVSDIQTLLINNKSQLFTADYWDLVDLIDSISVKLDTIQNLPKWLRSSTVLAGYNTETQITYVQKQKQSLESLANEIGYSDPGNEWYDIAIKNDLEEESYNAKGGVIFTVSWQNDFNFKLKSVVAVLTADNLSGQDLAQQFQFLNNDLLALSPSDTLMQNVNILITLLKGDNPEFRDDGVDKAMIGNLNQNFNIFPSLFRQIYNTFSKDDTLKSVSIIDINKNSGSVQMKINIETRTGQVISQTL
jgi:hypothetical protein